MACSRPLLVAGCWYSAPYSPTEPPLQNWARGAYRQIVGSLDLRVLTRAAGSMLGPPPLVKRTCTLAHPAPTFCEPVAAINKQRARRSRSCKTRKRTQSDCSPAASMMSSRTPLHSGLQLVFLFRVPWNIYRVLTGRKDFKGAQGLWGTPRISKSRY